MIARWIYRPLTASEESRMRGVKRTALLLALLLALSGCATAPGWGVLNNTGYDVVVTQDGKIAAHLKPGQNVELISKSWREPSLVSVVAYDAQTNYVGANSYTFSINRAYNWQVDHVFKPQGVVP